MATSPRIDDLRKKFDENPRRYFAPLANEYRKAGDLAQAIAICRQHLADQPGHMSGHIVYGQALFENKEYEEAQKVFTAALALDPENLIALRLLGDIARDGGDYAAAHGWYQRVLDADPRNEDIQAQLKLVQEAEERAAVEAAKHPLPDTIVMAAVPRPSTVAPTPSRASEVHEATTLEIERASPPWAKPAAPAEPLPPLTEEDVAPPRLSIMGLDLESMAGVASADAAETMAPRPAAPSEEFETSMPFSSTSFDADVEVDSDPLAGVSGIETRDESSAASLMSTATPPPPADEAFNITPPFGGAAKSSAAAEVPPELHMPLRVTPPTMELGLVPQPKPETTGLWDTLEDMEAEGGAALEAAAAAPAAQNFEPPPLLFEPSVSAPARAVTSLPSSDAFELLDAPAPEAGTSAPAPFVTETMADLYVQQGHHSEALATYRQLLDSRPGDAGLLAKIGPLEASAAVAGALSPVRHFFAALASWRPGQVAVAAALMAAHESHAAPEPVTHGAVQAVPEASHASHAADAEPWMAERSYDLGVFGDASITDADESAARRLAAMYPDALAMNVAPTAVLEPPTVEPAAPTLVELPGQPARQVSSELSLDQVFSDAPPQRPSRKSASFSFDQFFSQTAQVPAIPRSATPSAVPAQPSPEEAEQFQNWLKGLKGP